jgi:two-component system sensor histidine kinase RegB
MKHTIAALVPPLASASAPTGKRIRIRTLVLIRWFAVVGQAATVLFVHFKLGFTLPLMPVLLVIAASAILNLALVVRRSQARIEESRAVFHFAFDILQLALLLFLTGGLQNPFALLFIAPVTVSAAVLSGTSTVALSGVAVACIGALSLWHLPLPWQGKAFLVPDLYLAGLWLALVIGIFFTAAYAHWASRDARSMAAALSATQMALAREQRVSSLGALAAAAAHELGSPLATIAVVIKEMSRDVAPENPLVSDIDLLKSEVGRCRSILARLSKKPEAEVYGPLSRMSISRLAREAAAPYMREGIALVFEPGTMEAPNDTPEPVVPRRPELFHGLGTLIQNAIQFAHSTVVIKTTWSESEVSVEVRDNGPGFPPAVFSRLGEPYVSGKGRGDQHMGLGVFIAQTLLGHTGAKVSFENHASGGARAIVRWNRRFLEDLEGGQERT